MNIEVKKLLVFFHFLKMLHNSIYSQYEYLFEYGTDFCPISK